MLFKTYIYSCLVALASATTVIDACPDQKFSFHAQVVNFPPASITVANPTSNGDGTWDVTINFIAEDSMPLDSLSELKILSLSKTYMLYSNNLEVSVINNAGSWSQRVTVTPRAVGQYSTCMPQFTIQYDWCSAGVTDMSYCNTWKYQKSYDYITGCDNYDPSTGFSQKDAPDYCWNIPEKSSATVSSSASSSVETSSAITTQSSSVESSSTQSSSIEVSMFFREVSMFFREVPMFFREVSMFFREVSMFF
ncbi:Flo11 domain family protein [Clavispora lusitaniae]|uniref:Flo11 domain family protein n=1 Tax=Clavispora lusitaniae TaxID=36911 RepID=UPI00202C8D61|nr:Flo11 domain family protein [Clavispora lusitaniae]